MHTCTCIHTYYSTCTCINTYTSKSNIPHTWKFLPPGFIDENYHPDCLLDNDCMDDKVTFWLCTTKVAGLGKFFYPAKISTYRAYYCHAMYTLIPVCCCTYCQH